jgi:hypothetical protein
MRADTREPALTITPFPSPGSVGHFAPDRVWIAGENNKLRGTNSRNSTCWLRILELLHDSWLSLALKSKRLNLIRRMVKPGDRSVFPPEIPTHSAQQTFYFNDKGLLQRHDYATDVAGGVASHYCFDHVTFDDIVVPTFRRVVKRRTDGPFIHGPTAVLIVISDVSLS